MLKEWKIYAKVDDTWSQLSVSGGAEKVLTVTVVGNSLNIEWATIWGEWKELVESQEVQEIINKSKNLLARSAGKAKGKEKGGH